MMIHIRTYYAYPLSLSLSLYVYICVWDNKFYTYSNRRLRTLARVWTTVPCRLPWRPQPLLRPPSSSSLLLPPPYSSALVLLPPHFHIITIWRLFLHLVILQWIPEITTTSAPSSSATILHTAVISPATGPLGGSRTGDWWRTSWSHI